MQDDADAERRIERVQDAPAMMPAVADRPEARPPVSEFARTKTMSMPGTMMMPNSKVKKSQRFSV